jgi:diguanylate cyclase (GGDEF)-like protein
VAFRYGGEEFLLVLPGVSDRELAERAEEIRQRIDTLVVPVHDSVVDPRISIGGAVYPEHALDIVELLAQADAALYRAKDTGRNRVVIAATSGMAQESPAHAACPTWTIPLP